MNIPGHELSQRISRLQKQLQDHDMAGALLVQRADLYYFSGTGQNAHLFIPARGEAVLLVKKNLARARRESPLEAIVSMDSFTQLAAFVREVLQPGDRIGLEMDVLPANHYFRYQKILDGFNLVDVSPLIRRIRAVKSAYEVEQMREAAGLSKSVFAYASEIIREGMSEVELASSLEAFARARGHQGAVRMRGFNQELHFGHIMAGESAAAPTFFDGPTGGWGLNPSYPQGAGLNRVKRHQPILIDFVSIVNGYMVDQTRIFSLGSLPPVLDRAFNTALQIKQALMEMGRPGISGSKLYQAAADLARQAGLEEHFMGFEEKVSFVGHGVGLELDELPVIARHVELPLEEGMVFALEPKFIFPDLGVVGIEDTFLVQPHGLEAITSFAERPQLD
ncbi:MAG TPA: Xaa-Pro peptidase family protein [Bacillota bacterium]|nr:Xaa-Pro peptidase family protein [Bacillota bacterium]